MTGNGPLHPDLQISPDISRPKWVSREPPGANLQGSPRQGDALEVCGRWTCLRQVFGIKRCHMALSKHEVYDKLAIFKIICSWGGWWKFVDEIWCSGCMPRIFRQSQFISGWWFGSFWIILDHLDYFPFHIWDVIVPIDELHHFSRWAHCTTNQIYYLVAWFVIFPYIGNNTPIWLSYFSEGNHQPVVGWCWLHKKKSSYIPIVYPTQNLTMWSRLRSAWNSVMA